MNTKSQLISLFITLVTFLAFFISSLGLLGYSPDYYQYYDYFTLLSNGSENIRFEPAFYALSKFLVQINLDNQVIFGLFACIPLYLKLLCFKKFTTSYTFYIATALYLSKYFPLWELNQLRVGFASTFVLWSFYFLFLDNSMVNSKKNASYLMSLFSILLSFLFHFSSIIVLPIYALILRFKNFSFFLLLIIGASLFIFNDLIASQLYSIFFSYAFYNPLEKSNTSVNLSSFVFWPSYFLSFLLTFYYSNLSKFEKSILSIKILSIIIVFAFGFYGTFAVRSFELLSVLDIFLVLNLDRKNYILQGALICFALINFSFGVYLYFLGEFFSRT